MVSVRTTLLSVLLGLVMSMAAALPAQAVTPTEPAPVTSNSAPMSGEQFWLTGSVPAPTAGSRTVFLQVKDSTAEWRNLKSLTTGTGAYNFLVRITKKSYFRVASPGASGVSAVYSFSRFVPVAGQGVAAWIKRGCGSDNRCGGTAFAEGYVRPIRTNRLVVLQILSGSSWKNVVQGRTDSAGNFRMPFSISGWSQWTARRFRVIAGSYALSATSLSAGISFMPGPTIIGPNVLRVDVDGGASPATKGREYNGFATLIRNNQVLINRARLDNFGVRGSTTAGYPKKPYNLRFRDEMPNTANVFGMERDRRWTLLAMYADQSFVREKTALDIGRKLSADLHADDGKPGMTWAPDSRYVEMFVNSEYKGAYLMAEKVDIDEDRVDVDQDTGMIMEVDMDEVSDPRKGFRSSRSGLVFAFKEPDSIGGSEGVTPAKLSAIRSKIGQVESYLYTSSRPSYRSVIDRNSAADFHLAQEFIKDTDADFWRSKYFTWDQVNNSTKRLRDGRLHFGPLWDFDKSIGNIDPTNPATALIRSYRGWHANGTGVPKAHHVTYRTHWFAQLWKVPAFRAYLRERWNESRSIYATAYQTARYNKSLIGVGASNDRRRWAGAAKLYAPKGSGYDGEVQYVESWLKNRYAWMNSQLN